MTSPQRHDCAVAFCVDRNFFTLALFQIWQIAHLNPHRRFDFVIATQDDLTIPDWARSYGIVVHRVGSLPPLAEVARFKGSLSTLFRLSLARELGDRYRRIIYMDSDMFIEGGDFNRLMEIDLGPYPIAAVLDVFFFYHANHRAEEFIKAGLPAMPYFNSGFMVIDAKAFREQDLERRSMEVCRTHPHAIVLSDQSLLNLAMRGKFAELQPCWNWQLSLLFPFLPLTYPVFVHHFIGTGKPNRAPFEPWPVRFNQAYRDFMTQYEPEALKALIPPRDPAPLPFREAAQFLVNHTMASHVFQSVLDRHSDPYRAIL